MLQIMTMFVSVSLLAASAVAQGQSPAAPPGGVDLGTVRIPSPVRASGKPLPAGTYQLRLSPERPTPNPGQSSEAEQWVDFVSNGTVVAREIAEIIRDADLVGAGASAERVPDGVRVEMLKGGEFLRISVKRAGVRYLIHLPAMP